MISQEWNNIINEYKISFGVDSQIITTDTQRRQDTVEMYLSL